jgi:hypothetical protein
VKLKAPDTLLENWAPVATCATRVQVPVATYDTTPVPLTVQTSGVELVTLVTPSPVVDTEGVKDTPMTAAKGRLLIVGAEACANVTVKEPLA